MLITKFRTVCDSGDTQFHSFHSVAIYSGSSHSLKAVGYFRVGFLLFRHVVEVLWTSDIVTNSERFPILGKITQCVPHTLEFYTIVKIRKLLFFVVVINYLNL